MYTIAIPFDQVLRFPFDPLALSHHGPSSKEPLDDKDLFFYEILWFYIIPKNHIIILLAIEKRFPPVQIREKIGTSGTKIGGCLQKYTIRSDTSLLLTGLDRLFRETLVFDEITTVKTEPALVGHVGCFFKTCTAPVAAYYNSRCVSSVYV